MFSSHIQGLHIQQKTMKWLVAIKDFYDNFMTTKHGLIFQLRGELKGLLVTENNDGEYMKIISMNCG